MFGRVGTWSHVLVAGSALAVPAAVALGLVGGGTYPERFDAKQVVVWPASADGVRIREVVDQDFGSNDRHGYQRIIPLDFGTPTDIVASSPDANANIGTEVLYTSDLRIRLGDPDTTYDGQHRYLLSYTLPEAHLSSGYLLLDIIGGAEDFETGRFEVIVAGFELDEPTCHVGRSGVAGGCTMLRDGDVYRLVVEPLQPYDGITIEGGIVSMTVTDDPGIAIPALPDRRDNLRIALAAGTLALGAMAAIGAFGLARREGRNEVGGVSASDAAFVGTAATGANALATRRVSDAVLAQMATIEFVPPEGLHPWQGAVLMREAVDDNTVSAWFSEQIARERMVISNESPPELSTGPKLADAPPADRARITKLLGGDGTITLGKYSAAMATLWKGVKKEQTDGAAASGWWVRGPSGGRARYPYGLSGIVLLVAGAVGICVWRGLWEHVLVAFGLALAVPAVVAGALYSRMLPARSAVGSALALRVASFRRFLDSSEGNHVEWAYTRGLLREYSAWAVALGAADAWNAAILASNVPPPEVSMMTAPLMVHTYAHSFSSAHTAPSQSSGSGGGFSGGGFSGGGGGGGSSGSW